MLKVVIIGYGEMFTNLIAGTLDANCEIVGVLRKETVKYPKIYRWIKDIINPSIDYNYIKSYNLPEIISPKGVNTETFKKQLLKLNPDIILIGSWGEKLSKDIYNIPKIATINAHPSLLPKYRGPNPYFWVIKNKEQMSGVTFHLLDENYDTGAILAQEEVKIYPSDTGKSLKSRTVLTARCVICELLKDLIEDIKIPLKQREDKASYYSYPEDFEIRPKNSAEDNYALIRAAHPWYKTYLYHDITPLAINPMKVSIEENKSNYSASGTITKIDIKNRAIDVLCIDGKILRMEDLKLYKKLDQPFTTNYFKRNIKEGDIII